MFVVSTQNKRLLKISDDITHINNGATFAKQPHKCNWLCWSLRCVVTCTAAVLTPALWRGWIQRTERPSVLICQQRERERERDCHIWSDDLTDQIIFTKAELSWFPSAGCRPCLFGYENSWQSVDTKTPLQWFACEASVKHYFYWCWRWYFETSCQVYIQKLNCCGNWYQNKHGRRPAEGNQLRVCWELCLCLTDAGVPSVDVGEFEAQVTFTHEAPERVHTLPATRTHTAARHTLVDVCREREREREDELRCQRFIIPQQKNHQTDRCRCVCPDPAVTPATDRCIGPPPSWPDSRTDSWHGNRCERLWTQTHQRKAAKMWTITFYYCWKVISYLVE